MWKLTVFLFINNKCGFTRLLMHTIIYFSNENNHVLGEVTCSEQHAMCKKDIYLNYLHQSILGGRDFN